MPGRLSASGHVFCLFRRSPVDFFHGLSAVFAPVGFPEDLSGDVRGRTGAALKSDRGQSASGRPFSVIVDNFSIKCRRGGPSNAIKPYICFRYRFPRWRANPPGLKGNPVKVRNYPRSCKFLLGGTFSQPLAVRAGKACRPEQVRRPAVPGRDSLLSGEKRRNGFGCFVVSIAGSVNSIPACVVSGRIAANPSFRRGVFRFFRRVGKKLSDRTTTDMTDEGVRYGGLSCFCGESPAADICCRRAGSESAEFPSVELSVWGIRALKV